MEKSFQAVQWLIERYQKVAMAGIIFAFAFPFVTTGILWLDRSGYFENVYQEDHNRLQRNVSGLDNRLADMWIQTKGQLDKQTLQLEINHGLIRDGNFYQQRTCVNTATTREEREICLQRAPRR